MPGKKKTNTKKKILFVASEAVPFAKTGGMGDVCGALPKVLKKMGHDVRLVLPRYWNINKSQHAPKKAVSPMGVQMGLGTVWCEVLEGELEGVPVYFIEHEGYFGRAGYYDDGIDEFFDNAERFGFFCHAALQLAKDIGFQPDVVHCNDWQTGLIPGYLKIKYLYDPFFANTASVFTIHNIGYQGVFPMEFYPFMGLGAENFTEPKFESYEKMHFMKGAIFYADNVTTVSDSYRDELLTPDGAKGLAPYLERRRDDFYGILNGADYDHWDPAKDKLIPANYSISDISGKSICKRALQKEFLLKERTDIPVIGIITRFAEQKGFQHVAPIIRSIVNNMMVQFAIVGSGEKSQEDFFGGLPAEYPGVIGTWIGYENRKAHLIEAGADFFLMPSLYEPCGLSQIYSMKYGTLPIVRSIGGLRDTVFNYDEATGSGTGFAFYSPDPISIYYTVGWAVSTYYDRPHHIAKLRMQAMHEDYTWEKAAKKYERVYDHAIARRNSWK
ncbi:MAG: glycogen synthase [Candidatus Omnitrophica bacterium]|nr:glycogen synthase [Candidatus Omnitrophota bacterium]